MAKRKSKFREIQIPYNFTIRDYQENFWKFMENGGKRAICVWHRRTGKDLNALNFMITKMCQRVGTYWHVFPTYKQGKKAIWKETTIGGRKYMDYFPEELVAKKNETEMRVELKNGSIYQIMGTDDVDSLVGTNPVGIIFSEYPLQNPEGWDLLRPILAANRGWAVFVYTPRGKNHGWDLYDLNKDKENWFTEILTVDDTKQEMIDDNGKTILDEKGHPFYEPIVTAEMIEEERESGMDEAKIQQEYYCDFTVSNRGAYYTDAMERVRDQNRLGDYPHDPSHKVNTAWDLGRNDMNSIWFFQVIQGGIRVIDYIEDSDKGMNDYIKDCQNIEEYNYGYHLAPWDIGVHEYTTNEKRIDAAKKLGWKFIQVPKLSVMDGIESVRRMLPVCLFHKKKTFVGVEHLNQYTKKWDTKKRVYMPSPLHDEHSNGADAFRTMAVGLEHVKKMMFRKGITQTHAITDYDLHSRSGYNVDQRKKDRRNRNLQSDAQQGYDIFRGR
jgi:hypothetical protein